ncbi:MAG: hypothetical protein ABI548_28165 [Polyangiaceae bacterium]
MDHTRVLTASAMAVCVGLLAVVSCTRTTDRVLEPVGGDASTTAPELGDASLAPIGPLARPLVPNDAPAQDPRARSPEFGFGTNDRAHLVDSLTVNTGNALPGQGGGGSGGSGGSGGRPVATGGAGHV